MPKIHGNTPDGDTAATLDNEDEDRAPARPNPFTDPAAWHASYEAPDYDDLDPAS